MTDAQIDQHAKTIWNYMLMKHEPTRSDAIFVPCSLDTRVADYAAQLFKKGLGDYIIFSGSGVGRVTEHLFDKPEAETFADIALAAGVPKRNILIEKQATNTGENMKYTHALLEKEGKHPRSLLLVQKPYMERRTYATFKKQWPDPHTSFTVTSPPIPYDEYFNAINNKQFVIEAIVGDLQRIRLYGERGYQLPQAIPQEVQHAFDKLVAAGFTRRLLPDKK